MSIETQLRDALDTEASGTVHTNDWTDVVTRGTHRRRVQRVRAGIAGGAGLAAVVAGGLLLAGNVGDDQSQPFATDDGAEVTSSTALDPTPITPSSAAFDIVHARAGEQSVTIALGFHEQLDQPSPCEQYAPAVVETPESVTITIVDATDDTDLWAECQASPFSAWGTVDLDSPLADRLIVDGFEQDGDGLAHVANGDLLFPTVLPDELDLAEHDELGQEILGAWVFSWSTSSDLNLNVGMYALDSDVPFPCDGETVTVRGVEGTLCTSDDGTGFNLSWDEGGFARHIELGSVDGPSPFTADDVFLIADGLEPLE